MELKRRGVDEPLRDMELRVLRRGVLLPGLLQTKRGNNESFAAQILAAAECYISVATSAVLFAMVSVSHELVYEQNAPMS